MAGVEVALVAVALLRRLVVAAAVPLQRPLAAAAEEKAERLLPSRASRW